MAAAYRRRFLGRAAGVLWEGRDEEGRWQGLTDTYLRVRALASDNLYNRISTVRLTALCEGGLQGVIQP